MGLKIACLGAAPSSRLLAPFNDPSWEIWACSPPNHDLPRVDAWFELHNLDRKFIPQNQPWLDKIVRHPRVYIAYPDPRLPNAIPFPIIPLSAKYGRDFWQSSLAYMLAFAIELKPEVIGMWGVDMSANEEYNTQRPSCKFFMREAEKAGIKVITAPQSDIATPAPMYGYQEFSPMWMKQKVREKELQDRVAKAQHNKAQAEREELILRGALDDMQYLKNTYCPTAYGTNMPPQPASVVPIVPSPASEVRVVLPSIPPVISEEVLIKEQPKPRPHRRKAKRKKKGVRLV